MKKFVALLCSSLFLALIALPECLAQEKVFTIENCVNKFDMDKTIKTNAGYQYWFVDKNFIDGRTLKMSVVAPNQATHAPHAHEMDEFFFVLEGTANLHLDGKTTTAGPYTSFYCPSGIEHGISNAGDTELKYLVIKKYPQDSDNFLPGQGVPMASSPNMTDVSLFIKKEPAKSLNEIYSESGDLYQVLGHHGPAIENEYLGLRVYFNKKAAIDVYSKSKPGLELQEAKWYPTPEQQKNGWGADYYKVGETVGLGGIRLWDGEKVVPLEPVSGRYARVVKEGNISFMEMLSENVPYKDRKVDILLRVTVYSGIRDAKVEAFALSDDEVQFVTGLNYHKDQKLDFKDNYFLTWGLHPEDVAAELVELGAAIMFNPDDYSQKIDDGTQMILISKPSKQLEYWISSANKKESRINSFEKFVEYINQ